LTWGWGMGSSVTGSQAAWLVDDAVLGEWHARDSWWKSRGSSIFAVHLQTKILLSAYFGFTYVIWKDSH